MKPTRAARVPFSVFGATLSVLTLVSRTSAQTPSSPSPDRTSSAGAMSRGDVVIALVVLALIVAIVRLAAEVSSLERPGADTAAVLRRRIADALLADPDLGSLPIVATAWTPRWSTSPVRIEVGGVVPSPGLREAAISLVIREAFNSGVRFHVADRLVVDAVRARLAS